MRSGGSSFLRSERSKSNSSIESQKAGSQANSEKDGILSAFPSQLLTELERASVVHNPPTLQPEESLTRDASGYNASVMSLDLVKGTIKQSPPLHLITHIVFVTYTIIIMHLNFHNNSLPCLLFCH